ncbi:MAG: tRNA (adenosine(37)-N6)-threonylcarbamoyltransferase complex dimerization subunit type 1 TsaB [Magnetococcales bacterium]|nr:tRNA (adenosine(37)-N6)-threonylcarbamoyltransferase complex dimerization subunit type 1 TsaB [Magnetococcales bacterium]
MSDKVLAMDTSLPRGSMALLDGERLAAREWFEGPEGHVVLLARALERGLAATGWRPGDLSLLAVTVGPGSFTGARIALGVAKGLALATGAPLVGISTLELLLAGIGEGDGLAVALIDARRAEVYAQARRGGQSLVDPGVYDPAWLAGELARLADGPVRLTGNGLLPYGEGFRQALGERFLPLPPEAWQPDPVVLGIMARQRRHDADPWLEPLYLRRSDAREPA